MTVPDANDAMRQVAREVLGELVRDLVGDAPAKPRVNGHANGDGYASGIADGHDPQVVPQVPAPPVAAVLRPSTWSGPPVPGEVIGDRAPMRAGEPPAERSGPGAPPAPASATSRSARAAPAGFVSSDVRVEPVTIDTDEDLERFVRGLVARVENPRDRLAIRAGRLRFSLRRSVAGPITPVLSPGGAVGGAQAAAVRVVKGAVTERAVREAAVAGARLVLARGAVLTPLARDRASALGVEIERERAC